MSEVNYRRNGMKYSTTGRCWGMAPKAGGFNPSARRRRDNRILLRKATEDSGRSRAVSGGLDNFGLTDFDMA